MVISVHIADSRREGQCLTCDEGRSPLREWGMQSEGGARVLYTIKLVLSTVQGGITLITKLTEGGWGSV